MKVFQLNIWLTKFTLVYLINKKIKGYDSNSKNTTLQNSTGYTSNYECPLTLAIKSTVPLDTSVYVDVSFAHINNDTYVIPKEWTNIKPLDIMERIDRAKNNEKVEEVTVTLTKL